MTKCEGVARTQTSSISHFSFADLTLPIGGWGETHPTEGISTNTEKGTGLLFEGMGCLCDSWVSSERAVTCTIRAA